MKLEDGETESAFREREFFKLRRKGMLLEMMGTLLAPEGSAWSPDVALQTRVLLDLACGHERDRMITLSRR